MRRALTCLCSALAAAAPMYIGSGCGAPPVERRAEADRFQSYLAARAADLKIDPNVPLSMARCERLALANSLDLSVRGLALRLADDNIRLALTTGMPTASALYAESARSNANMITVGPISAKGGDTTQRGLTLQGFLPVLDFGLTYSSWQIALDRKHQEELVITRAMQNLRRDVRVAHAQHAGALRQQRLAEVAYQAAGQVLRVAKSLENAKLAVPADTALVEAAVAQAGLELAQVRQRVAQTHLALSQLMSLPPGARFIIHEALPALPATPSAEQVTAFENRALVARPELAVQDLTRHASASAVRREASQFFPQLGLNGSFNWTNSSLVVNPAFFVGGWQVANSLLNGGATLWNYGMARKTVDLEKQRTLLISLGVVYEVDFLAVRVRQAQEVVRAAAVLESSRRAGLDRIISLYKEGLEDEAGAARSLADLTTQATILDQSQTDYQVAWYQLEAAVLPEDPPTAGAATQPATQPAPGLPAGLPSGLSSMLSMPSMPSMPSTNPAPPASQPASRKGAQP
jgi:outer membrane protein TolC